METGRWPLDASPGEIITAISEHGENPSTRFAIPLVELFWLFGRTPEMGAYRGAHGDWLRFQFQNLADDAIMHPPDFESESEIVESAPAANQLERATPDPPADSLASTSEPRIPAEEIARDGDAGDDSRARAPRRIRSPLRPASNGRRQLDEIATARKDEVVQLYDLLKRLKGLPSVDNSETALRIKFGDAFKPLWDAIDQSKTLTVKDRKDFFRQDAKEFERYEFIAKILGSTQAAVRSLRFPRKTKAKKSRKTKRKKHA
jgi:hypothetical protein